jgi:hypothetical protein
VGSFYLYANSPVINLPPNQEYTLEFSAKFDLSYKTSSQRVYIYTWYKNKLFSLGSVYMNQPGTDKNGWITFTKDISAMAGVPFQIRLRGRIYGFGAGTTGKGIFVDNFKIKTSCNPKKCATHSQCLTVASCVQGSCANGQCVFLNKCCTSLKDCGKENLCYPPNKCQNGYCYFTVNNQCCSAAGDCDDGNPCTTDTCPVAGKLCKHQPVSDCCVSSTQCNDGKACTVDTCTANKCVNKDICCKADKDCDDKDDKCTVDKCVSGNCKWTLQKVKGCCQPQAYHYHFNDVGQGSGFTFNKCTPSTGYYTPIGCKPVGGKKPTQGWQVDPAAIQKKSANGALYYGNPSAKNFNFGANAGTVWTPKMKVPAGKSQIEFWIYWDTEGGTTYDKTAVFVYLDGKKKNIGLTTKPNSGALWFAGTAGKTQSKIWYHVKYDTSAFSGQDLQLLFYFNSGDSIGNTGQGVFVDDIKLTVNCD